MKLLLQESLVVCCNNNPKTDTVENITLRVKLGGFRSGIVEAKRAIQKRKHSKEQSLPGYCPS